MSQVKQYEYDIWEEISEVDEEDEEAENKKQINEEELWE